MTPRRVKPAAALVVVAVVMGMAAFVAPQQACAQQSNHAAVVVRFSSDSRDEVTRCVEFSQESITGIEALRLTGMPVVTKPYGSLGEYVCKIGDVGTDPSDCPAKDGSYWGYWRTTSQGWRHSGIGPSTAVVRCGSVDGWAWLQGGSGPAPSPASFTSVCGSSRCKPTPAPPGETRAPAQAPTKPPAPANSRPRTEGREGPQRPQTSTSNGAPAGPGVDTESSPPPSSTSQTTPGGTPAGMDFSLDNTPEPPGAASNNIPVLVLAPAEQKNKDGPEETRAASNKATTQRWVYALLAALTAVLAFVRLYLARTAHRSRR